jgi:pimeloyl-ACP methyl ester carboxylesterase
MDDLGLDAAVIVGHSGGSYRAQRFAVDHPERTLGIVLVGAFRAFHDNPGVLELAAAISALTDPVNPNSCARSRRAPWPSRSRPASSRRSSPRAANCRRASGGVRVWKAYLQGRR